MNIKETAKQIHQITCKKGFWEDATLLITSVKVNPDDIAVDEKAIRSMIVAQKIALIHSEVSEALEADRKGKRANVQGYNNWPNSIDDEDNSQWAKNEREYRFKSTVKDSVEDELADAVIRIMDLCEWMNVDLEWHIQKKMEYNNNRPYKHGKQY